LEPGFLVDLLVKTIYRMGLERPSEIGREMKLPAGVSEFGDLVISEFNGDATITYGVDDVIVLTGIDSGLVTADLFDFV